jgi:uncharacterized protein
MPSSLIDFLYTLHNRFYMSYTYRILVDSWELMLELWLFLLIGIVFTAVFQVFIDKNKLSRWVLKHPHVSIAGAAAFGVVSPLGTYVCIPMAGSLYSKGAPLAPLMAFLVASPILNPTIFMLTLGAFGYEMAFLRLMAGILLGIFAGYLFMFGVGKKNWIQPKIEEQDSPQTVKERTQSVKSDNSGQTVFSAKLIVFRKELNGSARYMLKYFSIAILIAAAIKNLVTADQVDWLLGSSSFMSVLVATGAGIPLYSCGGAAIPVLYQLAEMGMTPGAVLAFFISGPSTRLSNLVIIKSVFNFKILSVYLAIILAGAVFLGLIYNLLV